MELNSQGSRGASDVATCNSSGTPSSANSSVVVPVLTEFLIYVYHCSVVQQGSVRIQCTQCCIFFFWCSKEHVSSSN